jgi:hypothetical protein
MITERFGPAPLLLITGMDVGGEVFANDRGAWNVAKAKRDCAAGKHAAWSFSVAGAMEANANIEVDPEKVEHFKRLPYALATPCIMAMEEGKAWLIDGHHRLRALAQLGAEEFVAYVIEEEEEPQYRVLFNGQRLPPFPLS